MKRFPLCISRNSLLPALWTVLNYSILFQLLLERLAHHHHHHHTSSAMRPVSVQLSNESNLSQSYSNDETHVTTRTTAQHAMFMLQTWGLINQVITYSSTPVHRFCWFVWNERRTLSVLHFSSAQCGGPLTSRVSYKRESVFFDRTWNFEHTF